MNTFSFETVDFVSSECSVFSALADVVGLSLLSAQCTMKFFLIFILFFKKKERKKGVMVGLWL